jgi:hypothetical protein
MAASRCAIFSDPSKGLLDLLDLLQAPTSNRVSTTYTHRPSLTRSCLSELGHHFTAMHRLFCFLTFCAHQSPCENNAPQSRYSLACCTSPGEYGYIVHYFSTCMYLTSWCIRMLYSLVYSPYPISKQQPFAGRVVYFHVCRQPKYSQLAVVCKQLAAEQQRLATIKADLLEEKERKERLEVDAARLASHVAGLQASLETGDGAAAMAQMRTEVRKLQEQVHVTLPQCVPLASLCSFASLPVPIGIWNNPDRKVSGLQTSKNFINRILGPWHPLNCPGAPWGVDISGRCRTWLSSPGPAGLRKVSRHYCNILSAQQCSGTMWIINLKEQ